MKLQAPVLLFAVAVPSAVVPPSDTVTVEPSGAVPFKVTDSLEFATPLLMTGAAGGSVGGVPFAVSEILSRSHWLGPFAAENSSVSCCWWPSRCRCIPCSRTAPRW